MKCPWCGDEVFGTVTFNLEPGNLRIKNWCHQCQRGFNERLLVVPAELLWLIETARLTGKFETYGEFIDAIESYLSGDPSALRRLAGEEE